MSATHDFDSDRPILAHSAAARESTAEDATPGCLGKRSHEQMALRSQQGVRMPIDSPDPDISSIIAPYAHVEHNEASSRHPEASTRHPEASRSHLKELQLGRASPVLPDIPMELANQPVTLLYAGLIEKSFSVATNLLVQQSPVFAALTDPAIVTSPEMVRLHSNRAEAATTIQGPFFFPDLDEFAFALFVRWIYGGTLHGPKDFHSMNHYICLYVLAQRFDIEPLHNIVMDLVRSYYHHEDMTAPPFRLEYIYKNTTHPCPMREFLIMTAAYRALSPNDKFGGLSDSMKGVLSRDGDIAPDFAIAMVSLARNERSDARTGDPCRWHEHNQTPKCPKWAGFEPFEDPHL